MMPKRLLLIYSQNVRLEESESERSFMVGGTGHSMLWGIQLTSVPM